MLFGCAWLAFAWTILSDGNYLRSALPVRLPDAWDGTRPVYCLYSTRVLILIYHTSIKHVLSPIPLTLALRFTPTPPPSPPLSSPTPALPPSFHRTCLVVPAIARPVQSLSELGPQIADFSCTDTVYAGAPRASLRIPSTMSARLSVDNTICLLPSTPFSTPRLQRYHLRELQSATSESYLHRLSCLTNVITVLTTTARCALRLRTWTPTSRTQPTRQSKAPLVM